MQTSQRSDSAFSWPLFSRTPLIGILRHVPQDILEQIIPIYLDAGLTTLEVTMNSEGVEDMIRYVRQHYPTQLIVGAGTVCNQDDLQRALDAGAQFIVTPIINRDVIKACVNVGIPIFPGAYTPTEIYEAWSLGATMVKVFPATSLGPDFIKDVKAPFSQIKLMPTGGVSLDNIGQFLWAGADGLGVGSQLFDKKMIKNKDWDALRRHFDSYVKALRDR
ncbi:bifunctional 4-hydroxy-2-oxoglutarate aldolase/2-dehydro-3-deoxy-phosphogluconate aldolase [Telluribacter humicola]|uniref:bifunctional 4-hydroxy-2-oxoglutarate aldolase/2-dehydro-3-deoxy-phosphogluconate aldolase n=1 Tax=Telluribacter humicola TaxID=1720261 RepID=UPI001A9717B4|nr:bifunctional 4-hydroxy-2-oxoglutarate aldolase/2-dehydro-3-deoxy-phosphogluconate aldolase [Telluribacter humicola]